MTDEFVGTPRERIQDNKQEKTIDVSGLPVLPSDIVKFCPNQIREKEQNYISGEIIVRFSSQAKLADVNSYFSEKGFLEEIYFDDVNIFTGGYVVPLDYLLTPVSDEDFEVNSELLRNKIKDLEMDPMTQRVVGGTYGLEVSKNSSRSTPVINVTTKKMSKSESDRFIGKHNLKVFEPHMVIHKINVLKVRQGDEKLWVCYFNNNNPGFIESASFNSVATW